MTTHPLNIVLVTPEIPQNTGTIGRLCVCTGARLHLIEPLGFSLDEAHVRRAGLDYWHHVDLHVHPNWEAFVQRHCPDRLILCTTKVGRTVYDCTFQENDFLVFGRETAGLPDEMHKRYPDALYTIPMPGPHARSHNLANAVSIVLYEALRQISGW